MIALMLAPAFARIQFCPWKFKALLAAVAAFSHAVEYMSSITRRLIKVKLRKQCTHGCSGERCWRFPKNSEVLNFLWCFPSLTDILPGIIMVKSSRNSTRKKRSCGECDIEFSSRTWWWWWWWWWYWIFLNWKWWCHLHRPEPWVPGIPWSSR